MEKLIEEREEKMSGAPSESQKMELGSPKTIKLQQNRISKRKNMGNHNQHAGGKNMFKVSTWRANRLGRGPEKNHYVGLN